MSVYYIDLYNGSDSNNGTTWALAWKTINNGATSSRIKAGDIIRISKTPDPILVGNATWTNNSNIVTLDSAQTQLIDDCESLWTADAGGDATITREASSTTGRSGSYSLKMVLDSAIQLNKLQTYFTLPSALDLSSYQSICFWFKSANNWSGVADKLRICLCSDTVGAVIVDSFVIPGGYSTSWIPLTIQKLGGGNLGSNIRSIAIYTGTSALGTTTSGYYFDNFNACLADGLSLQSLISRNGSSQGGTEGFFAIQSINGTILKLDKTPFSSSPLVATYYTLDQPVGSVPTYRRESFKTAGATNMTAYISTINDSGLKGSNIEYQFGFEVGTTNQNGETYLDGLCGWGYGLVGVGKNYILINNVSVYRYYIGVSISSGSHDWVVENIQNISCNSNSGFNVNNCYDNLFKNIANITMNGSYGLNLVSAYANRFLNIDTILSNYSGGIYFSGAMNNDFFAIGGVSGNTSGGLYFTNGCDNRVHNITLISYCTYGIIFASVSVNNVLSSINVSDTATCVYYDSAGFNFFENVVLSDSTEFYFNNYRYNYGVWSKDHDGVIGSNKGFMFGCVWEWQTSVKHDTDVGAWKMLANVNTFTDTMPFQLLLAEIPCKANEAFSFKTWIKKDHATGMKCRLIIKQNSLLGIDEDIVVNKNDDTAWEELTILATPTSANPVVKVYFEAYYNSSYTPIYIGSVTVS